MTQEEVEYQKEFYQNASQELQERLERLDKDEGLSPATVGKRKHELICAHRLKFGRHPFVCSKCWSYLPVCVCHLATRSSKEWKYKNLLQVLVWTHHREWGLTSNTGSILGLTLGNNDASSHVVDTTHIDPSTDENNPCRLLMKGLPKHDEILQNILDDSARKREGDDESHGVDHDGSTLVVVLWPSSNPENAITLPQLRRELEASDPNNCFDSNPHEEVSDAMVSSSQKKIVLLAVDGTWRNARRMVAKLPSHVKRLDLDESTIRWNDSKATGDENSPSEDSSSMLSILAPLRRRGPSGKENQKTDLKVNASSLDNEKRQVCTAEAVVAALHEVGAIDTELAQQVLYATQTKVDRVRRYRGKVQ
ncbi:unnamed protein product [Cylindrotheca closterium]|uniref:tRNA-uridine aminocarboxypropyltransferase n=1 Tax=Cylindrotheca closterium TaxID=2856 RepID=A0AAD2G1H5_9STRA|nr:unnamed protein product [Cylindrotheca closterium]